MSEYALTRSDAVLRTADNASIPHDSGNRDRKTYTDWLAAGNVPDLYISPSLPDSLDYWDITTLKITFAHENRIRALEGKVAVTVTQFKNAIKALL